LAELLASELALKLKLEIGDSEGIEGIANWRREVTRKPRKDLKDVVKSMDPELFEKCKSSETNVNSLEVFDYRPYKPKRFDLELDVEALPQVS